MWTPPHFWALALFMKSDYDEAGVPMLTSTHGRRVTRNHILAYTVLLVPVSFALAFTSIGGPAYLIAAVLLNGLFLRGAWRIWRRDEVVADADSYGVEKKVFKHSLYYLFGLFTAVLIDAALRSTGLIGSGAFGVWGL
jgi:protoheme IX farnesyltransferase